MASSNPDPLEQGQIGGEAEHDKNREWPPLPWGAISQLSRPEDSRYRKLIAELVRANQASEMGDDELYVILKCLVGVLHFIDADPIVARSALTRPLGTLAASLRDLGQGARPALFFERPHRRAGRPKDVSFEAAQGAGAAALDALIKWGEAREAAAKFVADEFRRVGLKAPGGKVVHSRQVLRWREEIGGRASALAESTFKDVCRKLAALPPSVVADAQSRRAAVVGAIAAIRSMGF